MTRTTTTAAAVILSLILSEAPAAAADDASTAATIRTLRQAGVSFKCVPRPLTIQIGQVFTVGVRQVGDLVVGDLVIGVCTLGTTDVSTPSTGGAKPDTIIARQAPSQTRR